MLHQIRHAEMRILRLLFDCKTNAQIAADAEIAVDTAKQHCKRICAKPEEKNRHQAAQ